MKSDQSKWDDIYANDVFPTSPSPIVKKFFEIAKVGKALDIASGNGRNAEFLAKKGFSVDAVDISKVGQELVTNDNRKIRLINQDLDQYVFNYGYYDLVININFLNRRLFPFILNSLKSKGVLIFQTFVWDHTLPGNQNQLKSDHYLLPNELLHAFLPLQIHYYCEEEGEKPKGSPIVIATLIGQKR